MKKNMCRHIRTVQNYGAFYAARIYGGHHREDVSDDTGIPIKRIASLEKNVGSYPTIEEIKALENYYQNGIISQYYSELILEKGIIRDMPRTISESSILEKFIALDRPIMGNGHIMAVLDCSLGVAILARKKLEVEAAREGILLPPGAVIQTKIFSKLYGICKEDFEDNFDVITYQNERSKK